MADPEVVHLLEKIAIKAGASLQTQVDADAEGASNGDSDGG